MEKRAGEIAHLLVRAYEIHEIIIAETGGLRGSCYASRGGRGSVRGV